MAGSIRHLLSHGIAVNGITRPVQEAFFQLGTARLQFVAADLGGWFSVDEVLIAAGQLHPAPEAGWAISIDEETLNEATRWSDEREHSVLDISHWPPLIVGPFGATYSPILLYEQWLAETSAPPTPTGGDLVSTLHRATEVLGQTITGLTGDIGTIEDIHFDVGDKEGDIKIVSLEIALGGVIKSHRATLPAQSVRHDDAGFATSLGATELAT